MTDIEFLDSLEFRATIRKYDHSLIELSPEDEARLTEIHGCGYGYRSSWTRSFTRGALLQEIERARVQIAERVAASLTRSARW